MILAPSVLSLDYTRFNEQVAILNKAVSALHFDVMDGHFVPNLSFGPDILKAFKKASNLFMDVHLMVDDPGFFTPVFAKAGADGITFHYEAVKDLKAISSLIQKIKQLGLKAGIALKPATDVAVLKPFLKDLDLVLLMSVEPGFGGQSFMPNTFAKLEALTKMKNEHSFLIEVDGGVNKENAAKLIAGGVDILVAGSYVFKGDILANIKSLEK